jgi:[protein-PII] uridylyltransferase
VRSVEAALTGEAPPPLPAGEAARPRTTAFEVAPSVAIADRASTRTTVVEVNARDRPALLAALASAIHGQGHHIHSAHIATYGERAVDVFYLTRADGRKLDPADVEALRAALLHAAAEPAKAKAA